MDYFEVVKRHLKERKMWNDTIKKFPPNAIRKAINSILERIECDPQLLDWGAMFEELRDFDSIDSFVEHLSEAYPIYGKGMDTGVIEDYIYDLLGQLDRAALRRIKEKIEAMLYGPAPVVINYKGEFSPWGYIKWKEWESKTH